ncbi:hypothetical protein BBJ29_007560 [Phytophthora kernoviae]|uniref:Uncharacterized protein n=1 Tax=Phytophthora kernoviae TaxID=325452 RepID=A0A3F2RQF3_9STRA|nr:hypothetical protein BBJ29_007560 [Phytophthora kernoviae]RLN62232.1 hypothetical protein BBP00_00004911 [Phytophthora kernoviae]
MFMDKQQESLSPFRCSSGVDGESPISAGLWDKDDDDVSTLFFPANFLQPATPETFLELDPAGFFTATAGAIKGSCNNGIYRTSTAQRNSAGANCWSKVEPSREPCTDDIPWPDLVFWLGNASTGEVVCPTQSTYTFRLEAQGYVAPIRKRVAVARRESKA